MPDEKDACIKKNKEMKKKVMKKIIIIYLVSENGLFLAVVSCLFDLIAFSSTEERAQCVASGLTTQGELCLHLTSHNRKQNVTGHSE